MSTPVRKGHEIYCDTGRGSHVVNLAFELRKLFRDQFKKFEVFVEILPFGSIWVLFYPVVRFEKPLILVLSASTKTYTNNIVGNSIKQLMQSLLFCFLVIVQIVHHCLSQ